MKGSNNIEAHPADQPGCLRSFAQIGGFFAILIIVLFALKLLLGLN